MDTIAILDFGGQYCHLISRRIRDLGVFAEVFPSDTKIEQFKRIQNLKGIILSGGALSVYEKSSPIYDKRIISLGIPILGICYGHQLLAYINNGKVNTSKSGEYGLTKLKVLKQSFILKSLSKNTTVWMNHKDVVENLNKRFKQVAQSEHSPVAVFENRRDKLYGVQFHPEVSHTKKGGTILKNFAITICKAKPSWYSSDIIQNIVAETEKTIGNRKAIIGLSGGIDSSVAATLVSKAIGNNLTAVYVDTGLMRYQETEFIKKSFSNKKLSLVIINAKRDFFNKLKSVTEPERKRKIIGKLFIAAFNKVAQQKNAEVLIQGTIYSDRIESGITKYAAKIKSHHNVGGLPKKMKLKVYEPLRNLYKDEVRAIGKKLRLPTEITERQVFPGPGFAVRIVGEVTPEKTEIVRMASYIIEEELIRANLYKKVWMSFAVLLSLKSVGIQGDARSYKYPIVVRIIESNDAMTANFLKIPYPVLEKISSRITNEIKKVNRVVYDISNKPPATMEWE